MDYTSIMAALHGRLLEDSCRLIACAGEHEPERRLQRFDFLNTMSP